MADVMSVYRGWRKAPQLKMTGGRHGGIVGAANNRMVANFNKQLQSMMNRGQLRRSRGNIFEQRQRAANLKNEQRYAEGLGELRSARDRIMNRASMQESARREDLARMEGNIQSGVRQQLVSAGLANSSEFIPRSTSRIAALRRNVEADLSSQQNAYDAQMSGRIANFIESRTDQAPDPRLVANLYQGAGRAGVGGGGNIGARFLNAGAMGYNVGGHARAFNAFRRPMAGGARARVSRSRTRSSSNYYSPENAQIRRLQRGTNLAFRTGQRRKARADLAARKQRGIEHAREINSRPAMQFNTGWAG